MMVRLAWHIIIAWMGLCLLVLPNVLNAAPTATPSSSHSAVTVVGSPKHLAALLKTELEAGGARVEHKGLRPHPYLWVRVEEHGPFVLLRPLFFLNRMIAGFTVGLLPAYSYENYEVHAEIISQERACGPLNSRSDFTLSMEEIQAWSLAPAS